MGVCDTCIGGTPTDIHVAGDYAYLTGYTMGLVVVDCSDKTNPVKKGSVQFVDYDHGLDSNPRSVFVEYPFAYVVAQMAGFQIVNVSNPNSPQVVGRWDPGVHDMWGNAFVSGNYAYIADPRQPFDVVDVSSKNNPSRVGYLSTGAESWDVVVVGDHAFVTGRNLGLQVIDVSIKTNPQPYGSLPSPGGYNDYWWIKLSGDYAYLAGGSAVAVINIKDPAQPSLAGLTTVYKTMSASGNFDLFGDLVCVAAGTGGIQIFGFK